MSTEAIEKEELKEILRQLRSKKNIAIVRGQAKQALRRVYKPVARTIQTSISTRPAL
jgi:hypothetical protein